MARPSPVDCGGLVVTANSWPAPPVASSVWAARTSASVAVRVDGRDPPAPAALDDQVERRTSLRARPPRCDAPPRRGPARSRRRSPLRRRAPPGPSSGRPRGPAASPPTSSRSNTAPRAISSWTRAGPSLDEHADGVGVAQAGAGRQGVGQVQVGRVLVLATSDGRHAALGPPGGRLRRARPWTARRCAGPSTGWPPPAPRPRARRRRCRGPAGRDRQRSQAG